MDADRLLQIVADLEQKWDTSAEIRRQNSEKSVAEINAILAERYDGLRAAAVEMSGYLHAEMI